MNRTARAAIAVIFVAAIAFSAISICQNIARRARIDITEKRIYTLSDGTRAILTKLNQPVTVKLFYTRTAAMKGSDQIRYFNNYYYFVRALLEEYAAASDKVQLEIVDPRPFSDEEQDAIRHGLRRFTITREENFFFGLVVQTQFGVAKTIDFFSPDRQTFVEYDISYLIDTATTREKKRVGILSSLAITGDNATGYMAQMMRMQGRTPAPAWGIVQHLRQKYDVNTVPADTDEIKDIDTLIVIHPKDLPEKTQFAIDQFILKGGRAIICVDPHCVADRPTSTSAQQMFTHKTSSDLEKLLNAWGLTVPANTFAGDRDLAVEGPVRPNQRAQKIIGILNLDRMECFNQETVVTASLNSVSTMFPGVLRELAGGTAAEGKDDQSKVKLTRLVTTTARGNAWKVDGSFELMMPDHQALMQKFTDGTEAVAMGYMVTGKLKSAFPEGIDVPDDADDAQEARDPDDEAAKNDQDEKKTKHIAGLSEATEDCAVIVFSDVDFISDIAAYGRTPFGTMSPLGDNSSLLINSIEDLSGSSDLISIRTRGNFKRPFTVVDKIESEAEKDTIEEEKALQARIDTWQKDLNSKLANIQQGQVDVIANTIITERRDLEDNIYAAQQQLRQIKMKRRKQIESLGTRLRNFCTLPGPGIILLIAIALSIRRSTMKRHYISHASDS